MPRSIIEFYYKNDELNDPMVSEEHTTAFGWATPQEIDDIMSLAIRVNDFLSGLFLGVGIRLVDFKMECGRLWEGDMMRIVVADEISPDSCRLWDIKSNDKLDKDRFRRDLGGLVKAYTEVARRLGICRKTSSRVRLGQSSSNDGSGRPCPAAVLPGTIDCALIGDVSVILHERSIDESAGYRHPQGRYSRSARQGHRGRAQIARDRWH